MKNFSKIYSVFLFSVVVGLNSCGDPQTASDETGTVATEVEEPQDTRASPLRTADGTINGKEVKVQYGSPKVNDRTIWGDLVPYNEVWRTGANEATHVEFSQDVVVEGEPLSAGKYSLFTIPKESGPWTVIFNSEWDLEHGHYQYKEENDVLRVESNPTWEDSNQESLSVDVEDEGLVVKWEKLKLPISIE